MLQNTFLHLSGFGQKREAELWESGVTSWERLLHQSPQQLGLDLGAKNFTNGLTDLLAESIRALEAGNADYFAERLPNTEFYRIALSFPEKTAFLDLETTGLSHYYDRVTLIGVAMGDEYRCHIANSGQKSLRQVQDLLSEAKCLVTFNGSLFDLRFLRNEFPKLKLPRAHIDLRFFARSNGFRGGQKKIEHDLGFNRDPSIEKIRGERAPLLWHNYRLGNIEDAKTLIAYNFADVEGMRLILDHVAELNFSKYSSAAPKPEFPVFASSRPKLSFARSIKSAGKNRIFVGKYHGKAGPAVTYKDLIPKSGLEPITVVGIDLTGASKRPTGWAVLFGNETHTKLLGTDTDIIAETLSVRPDIVSIDSPLSLPFGRKSVFDDDPGRNEFGIMRRCERTLKRRGVNVYPSLLPSMQKLTRRGIKLANYFRELGIPVIESYPGAAQDIMGIPRKQMGLGYLKQGLSDFGIIGDFTLQTPSHDELDAITSAIVGLFFWCGRFEPLGNEDEDYLIIPDLEISNKQWLSRTVIGISGEISAGKTTAAEFLRTKKFAYTRYSLVLKEMLQAKGTRISRKTLQEFGEQVNKDPGQRWLCRKVALIHKDATKLAVDGMRFPVDRAGLIESFGPAFKQIHIHASDEIRYARYQNEGRNKRSFETASRQYVESRVWELAYQADVIIPNENSLRAFKSKLSGAITDSYWGKVRRL